MAGKTTTKRPTKTPKPVGRPTDYNEALAQEICRLILSGLSTRKIIELDSMPNRSTIYDWLARYESFADQYARACKLRREERFEQLDEMVDTIEDVQRARLKVDVIKWQLSKEEPKKYGDKIDVTSDGEKVGPVLVRFMGDDDEKQ